MEKMRIKNLCNEFLKETEFSNYFIEEINTVYAAGSLLEGFGNEHSDIDIFIFFNDDIQIEKIEKYVENNYLMNIQYRSNKIIVTQNYRGVDFDLEFHSELLLNIFIQKMNNYEVNSEDKYYDVVHRIKYGYPLINENNFYKLKKTINFEKFDTLFAETMSMYYALKITDIKGAVIEKAYETSFYMALDLLETCISAYLSIHGETNPSKKWLLKKIERYEKNKKPEDISIREIFYDAYCDINFYDINSLSKKTIHILKECQNLNTYIEGVRINDI